MTTTTTPPLTLLQMAGISQTPPHLADSVLLIIDAQREYLDGQLPLAGIDTSLRQAASLLQRARAAGAPVVHIVHRGGSGLFNPQGESFAIIDALKPLADEPVLKKTLINAFTGTGLAETLAASGRRQLIVIGYMTHNCVSATVRAALDHGYQTTVVAAATATRDLPDRQGGTLPAAVIQAASLAALADRTAQIVAGSDDIPD
jgi:nicotinamidase-related amidase